MTQAIFLHHYDASPFTQKALKMLALKGLEWASVIHPMIAPKPELTALTGGYRGTPVMQIGADIYIDSVLIAEELERRFPEPTLFPGGRGVALMLTDWADAYFRAGLDIAVKELSSSWDEAFYKDRDAVFPDLDFSQAEARFPDGCARLRNHARLLDAQLADGRAFLMGESPGLADIHAYVVNAFTRAAFPFVEGLLADFPRLTVWETRMAGLGEGRRRETDAREAHDAARNGRCAVIEGIDPSDPLDLRPGERVAVAPVTSSRGVTIGRLLRLDAGEAVIRPEHAGVDGLAVHFPRLGYTVRAV